jgi:ribosomal-protein-alanine N-acetyltransferase
LSENYWGKGVGTEVCKALVNYCNSLNSKKDIIAVTHLDNIGSQKVLLKMDLTEMKI